MVKTLLNRKDFNMRLIDAAHLKTMGTLRKPNNFFAEYDFHFRDLREMSVRLLEIGVQNGGSLHMWKEYFPNAVEIIGIDVDERCKKFESGNVRVYIGDQEDIAFLDSIPGLFDVIIDDGGHTMTQQQTSFHRMFPKLKDGGIYVIEDLHTSYWKEFGGKRGRAGTTIEWLKGLLDDLHFWASDHRRVSWLYNMKFAIAERLGLSQAVKPRSYIQEWLRSVSVSDSICFLKKGKIDRAEDETV